jgi:hypothetical protein
VTLFQFGSDLLDHVNIAVISLVSMYVGSLGHIDLLGHGLLDSSMPKAMPAFFLKIGTVGSVASANPCWDLSSATCCNRGVKIQWAM